MSNVVKIRCTICETVKDESAFHIKSSSHLGKDRRCKPCKAIIRHEYHLKSEYNLTVEEYDNMLKQQGGTCANEFCDYGKDDDHNTLRFGNVGPDDHPWDFFFPSHW